MKHLGFVLAAMILLTLTAWSSQLPPREQGRASVDAHLLEARDHESRHRHGRHHRRHRHHRHNGA
jgi:hypothetical protein